MIAKVKGLAVLSPFVIDTVLLKMLALAASQRTVKVVVVLAATGEPELTVTVKPELAVTVAEVMVRLAVPVFLMV